MLAGSRASMKSKMAVFNRRYLDVCVLINVAKADIVSEKDVDYRHGAASIGNPDLRAYDEILHGGLDQLLRFERAVDVDRLRTLAIPRQGHQRTKASRMIVMMVRNENRSDLSQINTSLRNAA